MALCRQVFPENCFSQRLFAQRSETLLARPIINYFQFIRNLISIIHIAFIISGTVSCDFNRFVCVVSDQFVASDFDFLQQLGSDNSKEVDRNSLLLRFDPLLKKPVLCNQTPVAASLATTTCSESNRLSITREEEEDQQHLCLATETSTDFNANRVNPFDNPEPTEQELALNTLISNAAGLEQTNFSIDGSHSIHLENDAKMNVGAMKDLIVENKENGNDVKHFECGDNKMR